MPRLIRVNWSGGMRDGTTSSSTLYETYSNTIHVHDQPETLDLVSYTAIVSAALQAFWTSAAAFQRNRTFLETIKVNFIDITTGLQITDPTNEVTLTDVHGAVAGSGGLPTTTACRISCDNGTRNRKARGGWYHPRPTMAVGDSGRWPLENTATLVGAVQTLFEAITIPGDVYPVIYSPTARAVFPITRVRVGDVPDNIRTRKDDLPEKYSVGVIDPTS